MLEAIRGAEPTVDLMTFVYWQGDIAVEFAEAMSERAQAGVRVRLLIDALGGRLIEKRPRRPDGPAPASQVEWFRKPLRSRRSSPTTGCTARSASCDGRSPSPAASASRRSGAATPATRRVAGHPPAGRGPGRRRPAVGVHPGLGRDRPAALRRRRRVPRAAAGRHARPCRSCAGSASLGWDDMAVGASTSCSARPQERLRIATAYFAPDDDFLRRAVRRGRARASRSTSCCPGRTPTSGSCQLASEAIVRPAARLRGRALDLPAVDAARQGHDRRRGRRPCVGSSNFNRRSLDHDEEVGAHRARPRPRRPPRRATSTTTSAQRRRSTSRWRNRSHRPARDGDRGQRPIRRWM